MRSHQTPGLDEASAHLGCSGTPDVYTLCPSPPCTDVLPVPGLLAAFQEKCHYFWILFIPCRVREKCPLHLAREGPWSPGEQSLPRHPVQP